MIIKTGWGRTPVKLTQQTANALADLVDRIDYVYAKTDGTYGELDVCVADKVKYIEKLLFEDSYKLGEKKLADVAYTLTFYNDEKWKESIIISDYSFLKINLHNLYERYEVIYIDRIYYYGTLQTNGKIEITTKARRLWSKGHYSELGVNLGDKK